MAERLLVIGQDQFGEKSFRRLRGDGHKVLAVIAPENPTRPDPLWIAAEAEGYQPISDKMMGDPDVQDRMRNLKADAGVAAFVTEFIPLGIRKAPDAGVYIYHPSLLPKHRGPEAMRQAIQDGDTETGETIFQAVKGLDAGPILLQRGGKEIGLNDNVTSLYFGEGGLFERGIERLSEAMKLLASGQYELLPQDETVASFHHRMTEDDAQIPDLAKAAALTVHNFIRGADPAPGAWATLNGEKIKIFNSTFNENVFGEPGRILDVNEKGALVALNDGSVVIARVRGKSGGKVSALEYGFRVGDKLQTFAA